MSMGPFQCSECGAWWGAGFEHRCHPVATATTGQWQMTVTWPTTCTTPVCTCPLTADGERRPGGNYNGVCPVHGVLVTFR